MVHRAAPGFARAVSRWLVTARSVSREGQVASVGLRRYPGAMQERQQALAAWLETLGVGTADTIQRDPAATIRPADRRWRTAEKQAGAFLQQLADDGPRLQLMEVIGQGGMGVVRLAAQVALGRRVAVKMLRGDRRSEQATRALLREAWVTGSLEHPNVVPVHDIGVDEEGQPLIILKRIEGVPWIDLMGDVEAVRTRFGADDLLAWNLDILLHVINAVRFAHSRGVLHRDLKPENVMIGEFGEVYVLDWGIAVSLHDDHGGRLPLASEVREIAGTPCYMAPEMLGVTEQTLSERTDVYLLGGLLYEVMSGHPPHRGDSAVAIASSVLRSQPEFPPTAPVFLVEVCRRALSADPADRFASADELRNQLQLYLAHRGSARLAARAHRQLGELQALIARARSDRDPGGPQAVDDEPIAKEGLYKLFGACRFGFHEALSAWPENREARAGLERALSSMADYELTRGHASAAEALLVQMEQPPEQLRQRVAEALHEHAHRGQRMAELERLSADLDAGQGARTRTFVTAVLAVVCAVCPLALQIFGYQHLLSHESLLGLLCGLTVLTGGMFFWARESMSKTAVNRRSAAATMMALLASLALQLGFWSLAIPVQSTLIFLLLLWALAFSIMGLSLESTAWVVVASYTCAFALSVWRPQWVLYWHTLGHAGLVVGARLTWLEYRHLYLEREGASAEPDS